MNITEIGAVGEMIGGVGVIVTLLYLAAQIRQSTKQQRFSSSATLWEGLNQAYDPAYYNNNMPVYRKGLADEPLDADEYMTFAFLSFRTFSHFHQIFVSHKEGYVDDDVFNMHSGVLLTFLGAPGIRKYWSTLGRQMGFRADFVGWVNGLEEEAGELPEDARFWDHREKSSGM